MQNVLKYTYLMDVQNIDKELTRLWVRYQQILNKPNWEDLNEARAILYFIGHIYCENIAPKAIERRLHLLSTPLSLLEFFTLIDTNSSTINQYNNDHLFQQLQQFYLLIKKHKNNFVGGQHYLDEEKFIQLYNSYNPNQELKIKEKGKF